MKKNTKLPDSLLEDKASVIAGYLRAHDGILPENVRYVGHGALKDCRDLKKLVVPDNANIGYSVFEPLTGLEEPVFNVSRTVLYRYPEGSAEEEYTLPDGTEIIKSGAFLHNDSIRRVVIPESVGEIDSFAFQCCGKLSEIVIENPDIKIGSSAFNYCNRNLKIRTPDPDIPDNIGIFDAAFLMRVECSDIPTAHCRDRMFEELCRECGKGNAGKMWELGVYFDEKGDKEFYRLAANFWKYRAMMYGSSDAEQWFNQREITSPGEPIPAPHWERPFGKVDRDLYRGLGFLFIPASATFISKADEDGVVLVQGALRSSERVEFDHNEYCYDWYLLNEHFAPIEGVAPIKNLPADDVRYSRQYETEHARAAAALKGEPLPPRTADVAASGNDESKGDKQIFRSDEDETVTQAPPSSRKTHAAPARGWFGRIVDRIFGSDD